MVKSGLNIHERIFRAANKRVSSTVRAVECKLRHKAVVSIFASGLCASCRNFGHKDPKLSLAGVTKIILVAAPTNDTKQQHQKNRTTQA